jgi:methionyl-tRNA synthetase
MESLHVQEAINHVISLFRRCNKYIDETEPWNLAKDASKQDRLQTVLYNLVESIRIGAIVLKSFIPETSAKILDQLKTEHISFDSAKTFGLFELNRKIVEKPEIIFARLDLEETMEYFINQKNPKLETKPEISFEEFTKLDMRTGVVVSGEKHPKADKLYILQVEVAGSIIQIVSGLVGYFELSELIGKSVVVVVNLKPAVLRGVESNGMIVAAKDGDTMDLVSAPNVASGTPLS